MLDPLRSIMGVSGGGAERSCNQPLCVPVEKVSHTGASGLLLFLLSSLCYQRGILTALSGSKSFQVPAQIDARVKIGARGQLGAAVSITGQASLRLALAPAGQLHTQVLRDDQRKHWRREDQRLHFLLLEFQMVAVP